MLKKLRRKFVCLAMAALFSLLSIIVTGMNLINYKNITREADTILSVLLENKGAFPDFGFEPMPPLPRNLSPEVPYESRYFSVFLDASGEITGSETTKIASVNDLTAESYAEQAMRDGKPRGFVDQYRFALSKSDSSIVFLDWGRRLDSFYSFLYTSIGMSVLGLLIVFPIIYGLSGKILRPVSESYEKQKRFITDAGHEIKTPLTIINANTDLIEMELGVNEGLQEIRQQTSRLKSLTGDLVLLSRMEETTEKLPKIEFPVSDAVLETALPFKTPAARDGKTLNLQVESPLTLNGEISSFQKLVSILLDNALKYSPRGSEITLSLAKQKNSLCLTVTNPTETVPEKEQLPLIFDRFYRADSSRNSETGGHGIGLSIAQLIVKGHGGKISASVPAENTFRITAVFPIT